ncbi:MAG: putative cytosol aminopeptidase [Saprospiraceae bacterium]|nr:MAG: putative cytosol aminopeptidase [Saprospiraceae bacterium]
MTIDFFNTLDRQQPEILLIPVANDNHYDESLQSIAAMTKLEIALIEKGFKAELGETLPLFAQGKRIYLLGLGNKPSFQEILKVFRSFAHKTRQKLTPIIGVSFKHQNLPTGFPAWVEAITNGLMLGTYQIGKFKSEQDNSHPLAVPESKLLFDIDETHKDRAREAADKGLAIAETQLRIFDLVNAPSNKKLPSDLAAWAVQSGKAYNYSVEVFDMKKIQAVGLHALLAVNRGSEYPASFIIMEYKPKGAKQLKKIGLVGKGVTFDTGGLSIKPSTNMHYMKSDMSGAGAVFGAMEAAAKLKLPVHLIGIVPATDNSVDATAIKPSDVIESYSGKTIEIIDTDAEGRLILADGLAYMNRHFKPDVMIDLATLTGSAVRTFGYQVAALFSNNDQLANQLSQVSESSGEWVWRLPIWDIYKDDLKSDVADIRNFSGKPLAGAIMAAKFLEAFTGEHPCWAHLDIAGVAFNDSEFSTQKSSTAYGVRLLTELVKLLGEQGKG